MALTDNLIAAYNCDTSGSFADSVGSNTGTRYGSAYTASGLINGGEEFDGTNDSVVLPVLSGFSDQISISFWVYPDNFTNRSRPINNYHAADPSFTDWILLQIDATTGLFKVRLEDGGITDYSSGTNLSSGVWNHIVVTLDTTANTIEIYINNSKELDTSTTKNTSLDTYPWGIGEDARVGTNNDNFDGKMDMIYFWNKIVSSTEVSELYNSNAGLQYPFTTAATTNAGLLYMFT